MRFFSYWSNAELKVILTRLKKMNRGADEKDRHVIGLYREALEKALRYKKPDRDKFLRKVDQVLTKCFKPQSKKG